MDRRRVYPGDDQWERPPVGQPVRTDGGIFTVMPGGLGKWEATPQPPRTKLAAPRAMPRMPQQTAVPSVPQRASRPTLTPAPKPVVAPQAEERTRIFKPLAAHKVPTAARAVAEHAIKHGLALHGLPPSMVELQWVQRLAPGATVMYEGEFRADAERWGTTRSAGPDGRQVSIVLRHDLPLEDLALTALHEAFHAVQYLTAPLVMRDGGLLTQVEHQAEAFARQHLRDLRGLIESFQRPKRVGPRS